MKKIRIQLARLLNRSPEDTLIVEQEPDEVLVPENRIAIPLGQVVEVEVDQEIACASALDIRRKLAATLRDGAPTEKP